MIQCIITSPGNTAQYANVLSVTLPASGGHTEILPHHAEAFLLLDSGSIVIRSSEGKTETVEIKEGVCYVKEGKVVIVL